jgi:hypothetical protein
MVVDGARRVILAGSDRDSTLKALDMIVEMVANVSFFLRLGTK